MLQKVDFHLVDHCNLNCKGCNHLSPLAEEFFLDINEFEKDLGRLAHLTQGNIGEIFLIGGEPLLHPEIIDFFPITRNLFRNSKIVIITNGILLNKQDDKFWSACRRSDIQLWVSAYSLELDYKRMEEKAREAGVFLGYTGPQANEQNQKMFYRFKFDTEGKQYWANSFEKCCMKNCVAVKKGKMYTCCMVSNIENFNRQFGTNLEVSEFDYIDIYKINSYQAILEAMVKPIPFCRYCKPSETEYCAWEHSKKDISEWT